jgi:hypothetical protein
MAIRNGTEEAGTDLSAQPVEEITPEFLRAEALRLREESDAARRRAVELQAAAIRLEREANALETVSHLPPVREVWEPSPRAVLAGDIATHLNHHRSKRKSSTEIAAHFGVSVGRAKSALELAVECGFVRRTGLKRGTRYQGTGKEPEGSLVPFGESWRERVRDAAVKLEVFTLADIRAELGEVGDGTLSKWLRAMVDDGLLEVEREGRANTYLYVPPVDNSPTHRRRVEVNAGPTRGGEAIAGTGRSTAARQEVRDLLRLVTEQGGEIRREGKHDYLVELDGVVIDAIPKTASDARSLNNARAKLKRGGFDT